MLRATHDAPRTGTMGSCGYHTTDTPDTAHHNPGTSSGPPLLPQYDTARSPTEPSAGIVSARDQLTAAPPLHARCHRVLPQAEATSVLAAKRGIHTAWNLALPKASVQRPCHSAARRHHAPTAERRAGRPRDDDGSAKVLDATSVTPRLLTCTRAFRPEPTYGGLTAAVPS